MKYNKSGFTLIEMLIAMSIFFIMVVMTYANYAYFQNIARVKLSLKEISQSINEARNMAISWLDKNWVNQSVWVYFDLENKNLIRLYSYNYNSWVTLSQDNLIKERKLQDYVWIDYVWWKNKVMIYFSSIYAKPEIYYFDDGNARILDTNELDFKVSFKNALGYPLKRDLRYFKNTNVVDY